MTSRDNITTVDDDEFECLIKQAQFLILYYRADWAGPCQAQDTIIEQIAAKYPDLTIAKVDVDENKAAVEAYDIESVPTMILFKDTEPVDAFVGKMPLEVLDEELGKYD